MRTVSSSPKLAALLKQLNEHQDIKYVSEDTATHIFDRLDQRHDGHRARRVRGLVDALRTKHQDRGRAKIDRHPSGARPSASSSRLEGLNMWWMLAGGERRRRRTLQTRPQLMGKAPKEEAPDDPLELVETGLAVVYAVEACLKMGLGWRRYCRSTATASTWGLLVVVC